MLRAAVILVSGLAVGAAVALWLPLDPSSAQRAQPGEVPSVEAPVAASSTLVSCAIGDAVWSATRPPVNLSHIFCGELNRRDRAVGFHSRPGGGLPGTVRDFTILRQADAEGVYTATFEVGEGRRWREKERSTFFPDHCGAEEVLGSILHALEHGDGAPKFRGPSGPQPREPGFCYGATGAVLTIEGWLLPDGPRRINTAWPVRRE